MSQATLKTKIKAAMIGKKGVPEIDADLDDFADAMATAIVDWFEQDAVSKPGNFAAGGNNVTGTGELTG